MNSQGRRGPNDTITNTNSDTNSKTNISTRRKRQRTCSSRNTFTSTLPLSAGVVDATDSSTMPSKVDPITSSRKRQSQLFQLLISTLLKSNQIVSPSSSSTTNKSSSFCHHRHHPPPSPRINNSSKRIQKILESRGMLIHILTSNDALHRIACTLPSLSLVQLLSVLMEMEISSSMQNRQRNSTSSNSIGNSNGNSNSNSNNIQSIMKFVEQIIVKRYFFDKPFNIHNDHTSYYHNDHTYSYHNNVNHQYHLFEDKYEYSYEYDLVKKMMRMIMNTTRGQDFEDDTNYDANDNSNDGSNSNTNSSNDDNQNNAMDVIHYWVEYIHHIHIHKNQKDEKNDNGKNKENNNTDNNGDNNTDTVMNQNKDMNEEKKKDNITIPNYHHQQPRHQQKNQPQHQNKNKSTKEDYVLCMTFMIAYTVLYNNLEKMNISSKGTENETKTETETISSLISTANDISTTGDTNAPFTTPNTNDGDGSDCNSSGKSNANNGGSNSNSKNDTLLLSITHNEIIVKSLRIILFTYIAATIAKSKSYMKKNGDKNNTYTMDKKNKNDNDDDGNRNVIEYCFRKQWMKANNFVQHVHNLFLKKGKNYNKCDDTNNMDNQNDNEYNSKIHNVIIIHQPSQEESFDALWEEIQKAEDGSENDAEDKKNDNNDSDNDTQKPQQRILTDHDDNDDDDDDSTIPISQKKNIVDKSILEEEIITEQGETGIGIDKQQQNNQLQKPIISGLSSIEDEIKKSAIDVRQELFEMGQNATSTIVQSMTKQITVLLQKAGKEFGSNGIIIVATILKYGKLIHSKMNDRDNSNYDNDEDCDQEQTNDNERLTTFRFPDVFISSLSKACITEETSAVRASTFMTEFVLPSVHQLKDAKSRTASRLLVATLSFLARDRPVECASSILVPSLCGTEIIKIGSGDIAVNNKANNNNYFPSKAQCELVSKIVKQVAIPKDVLASIIADLTSSMIWNEQTVPVITTCLQKKPQLNNDTIKLIVNKIQKCTLDSNDNTQKEKDLIQVIRKGIKFSTLFRTFVTKYRAQIQNGSFVNVLIDAAGMLKTILGKSICTTLKKMK